MGFLDDLQRGADSITKTVTGTVDDTQARYRADALFHDYGLLIFRQQTGASLPTDAAELERVWSELHAHLTQNPSLVPALKTALVPAPPPLSAAAPPPPPPGAVPAAVQPPPPPPGAAPAAAQPPAPTDPPTPTSTPPPPPPPG